jgi:sporulation protein YlmC with PRC-barrel domain
MRLSELVGCAVTDGDGQPLGHVTDVRLRREGPELEGFGPAYVVAGLRVTHRRGNLFGYDRADAGGPAAVRWLFRRLHRGDRVVPWGDVEEVGPGRIRLRSRTGTPQP